MSHSDDNKFFLLFSNLLCCKLVNTLSSLILSDLLSGISSSIGQTLGKTPVTFIMISMKRFQYLPFDISQKKKIKTFDFPQEVVRTNKE